MKSLAPNNISRQASDVSTPMTADSRSRCLPSEPLIEENHQKQRGQYEIKTVGIERQMRADQPAQCGAGHPIQLIAQRNPEVEPATVDAGGDFRGGVDGKVSSHIPKIRYGRFQPSPLNLPSMDSP